MHVPDLLERVHLCCLDEVFVVTRVDAEKQEADLLPIIYSRRLLEHVPFVFIEAMPCTGPPSQLRQDDNSVTRDKEATKALAGQW